MTRYRPFTTVAVGLVLLTALAFVFAEGQEKPLMPSESQEAETPRSLVETPAAKAPYVKSGLQVGETIASFEVQDVTGPNKGMSVCYACDYGTCPVISVFIRSVTAENAKLIQELNQIAVQHMDDNLKVFVVLLSMDPEADRQQLIELEQHCFLAQVPLTLFDGITGPRNFRIAQNAAETVMMWNNAKIKSNHAFGNGQLNDEAIAAILSDLPKILE
jgi:hypothetical protein